jgi:ribosomal protein S18 acetylase RimI-like enzyme
MTRQMRKQNIIPHTSALTVVRADMSRLVRLTKQDENEVTAFLRLRPVHTVVMSSFITDNGIESELNRGTFYGYRSAAGELEGVALIGHSTLVEARSDESLQALAIAANSSEVPIHLIMSSGDNANRFWTLMGRTGAPRLTCTEALFEAGFPFPVLDSKFEVTNATAEWLEQVAEAQAEVAFIESGVDPLARDREGFLRRCARRIEQGRVFVVTDGDKMVFKADIIAESGGVAYLEGVYVNPEYRGHGIGSSCLAALTVKLLERFDHVSLLSNVNMTSAHRCFLKAGYRQTDVCTTLFA